MGQQTVFLIPCAYRMVSLEVGSKKMSLSEKLRKTIISSKQSRYAIAVGSGVDHAVLRRFVRGERDIKLRTAESLCAYLGLELVTKRKR
jgi:hypothetical protein